MQVTATLFPSEVVTAAQKALSLTGCPASVALAQWAQESGFGKYQLNAHNPFGMKWYMGCPYPFVVVPTKEWVDGHYEVQEARFIAFPDLQTAFIEHGKLLMNPNGPYAGCIKFKDNWKEFVQAIAKIYATDPHYEQSLISLIQLYKLYLYDAPLTAVVG
jgi:flagellum-specific peptidoglycan hydrolase FlgJ